MTINIGSARVVDEALNITDPRIGAVMNSDTDQSQKIVDAVALAAQTLNGAVQIPPGYLNVPTLSLVVPNTRTVPIRGAGGNGELRAATVLKTQVERPGGSIALGSGRVISVGGGSFPYHLEGFCLYGPRLGAGVKGSLPAQFDAIRASGRGTIRDVTAIGYRAGIQPINDQHTIDNCNLQGNGFALDWGSGSTGIGDTSVRKSRLNGCTLASVGVAQDSAGLSGVQFDIGCHLGTSPFAFYRYAVSGAPSVTGWIAGLYLNWVATEYLGNGFMYDEVGDGSVDLVKIVGQGGGQWGMFNPDMVWAAMPQLAAWHTGQSFSQISVKDGHLWSDSTDSRPTMLARSFSDIRWEFPRNSGVQLTGISPGARWFAHIDDTVNPSAIRGISVGSRDSSAEHYTAAKVVTGPIEQYDLLAASAEYGVKVHTGAATDKAVGVAMHPAATNKIAHMATRGRVSHVKMRNKTASQINNGSLLKPDPANPGGVIAATGFGDGQIVGRALANIAAGTVNQCDIFI
jgi:hypothetical protein